MLMKTRNNIDTASSDEDYRDLGHGEQWLILLIFTGFRENFDWVKAHP